LAIRVSSEASVGKADRTSGERATSRWVASAPISTRSSWLEIVARPGIVLRSTSKS
jgi:hypothetical protein